LANGFGNLASRVIAMIHKYFDGVLPAAADHTEADLQVIRVAEQAIKYAETAIDDVAIQDAISSVWTLVDELNNYITVQEPWALAKSAENRDRLATVLNTTAEGLRVLAIALTPVTPKATSKLWAALGTATNGPIAEQKIGEAARWGQLLVGGQIGTLEALFPRIENEAEGK
jgi:methionyl-tRNA synthetase